MAVVRILGWLLIACAVAALGVEVARYFVDGTYEVLKAGRLWSEIGRGSLARVEDLVETHLPLAWDLVVAPALQLPAWALAGIPGIIFVLVAQPRASAPQTSKA